MNQTPVTSSDAVKFVLENEDLDLALLVRDIAINSPHQLIDALAAIGISPEALTAHLIKTNPDNFMKVAGRRHTVDTAKRRIIDLLLWPSGRIECIKLTRGVFSFGLKEAKDVYDNLHCAAFKLGLRNDDYAGAHSLSDEPLMAYNELLAELESRKRS
jgi:ribosomal protein L7/L12